MHTQRVGRSSRRRKKPGGCRAFSRETHSLQVRCIRYLEDDFFDELRDEEDLRADDLLDDFFAPLFEPERDALDFFALDLEPDLEDPDFEALLDELFLLVAGDFAIADVLSFPSKRARESHLPPW